MIAVCGSILAVVNWWSHKFDITNIGKGPWPFLHLMLLLYYLMGLRAAPHDEYGTSPDRRGYQ